MSYIGNLLHSKQGRESNYHSLGIEQFDRVFRPAVIFSNYLISNIERIEFLPDRSPWSCYSSEFFFKFFVEGGQRKNSTPRERDPEPKKIWNINQNPETDTPVLEVHYGRILMVRHIPDENIVPTPLSLMESLAYLTQFQDLDTEMKQHWLQEPTDFDTRLAELELQELERGFSKIMQRQAEQRAMDILDEIQSLRQRILEKHNDYIRVQHQTERINSLRLDLLSLKRLADVESVTIEGDRTIRIITKQIPVRYFDEALYQRYRSNYYSDYELEMMDHVIAGRAEICCAPKVIKLDFGTNRIDFRLEHLEARIDHPHRTCSGNFAGPLDQARMNYDLYGVMSNLIQWFSSLAFDDSTVARGWLWSYSGFRIKDKPETLIRADNRTHVRNLIRELDKIKEQEEPQVPELEDLDLELEI